MLVVGSQKTSACACVGCGVCKRVWWGAGRSARDFGVAAVMMETKYFVRLRFLLTAQGDGGCRVVPGSVRHGLVSCNIWVEFLSSQCLGMNG
jgi:hypothetical protein